MERAPLVLIWFYVLAGGAAVLMLAVALSTRRVPVEQQVVMRAAYAVRRVWLWVLAATVIVSFVLSLPWFPYPEAAQSKGLLHYAVVAQQYSFSVPAAVPYDTNVIFDVTSNDVNHGFGIYDPNGDLVAQVQAMPHYTNHLPVKFTLRGRYTIRCLEYCGIAHHLMQAGFKVQ
jgi:cytochrome c oxidase subunit 2